MCSLRIHSTRALNVGHDKHTAMTWGGEKRPERCIVGKGSRARRAAYQGQLLRSLSGMRASRKGTALSIFNSSRSAAVLC